MEDVVTDTENTRGRFVACLLRLAGHDFMDFRYNGEHTGGSDGCVNFEDPDNKGLSQCLTQFKIPEVLEKHKDEISTADFIVLAAEAAMGRAAVNWNGDRPFKAGTLMSDFMRGFRWGRKTEEECHWNVGFMPNPEHGCHGNGKGDGLEQIFVNNIFKDYPRPWSLTAAINGAHTVGKASLENSGYEGHWSHPQNQGIFGNGFYRAAL